MEVELAPVVGEALARRGIVDPDAAAVLLRSLRDDSGLFTGWSSDRYGFLHLGFQEYLAARVLRRQGLAAKGGFAELAGRFGDGWWQEVILLMLAIDDEHSTEVFEGFMGEVARSGSFAELWTSQTMRLCMEEARGKSARPFVELASAAAGADGRMAQLAALKLLEQHMPDELARMRAVPRGEAPRGDAGHRVLLRSLSDGTPSETRVVAPNVGGVELVRIPGGTFMMGSRDGESDESDEQPRRKVTLAAFELGRYPVTDEEYGRFLEANPDAKKPKYWGDRKYNQTRQPVVGVSWKDALKYCEWAGPEITLPTEAQWEYACRGGEETRYWSGDTKADLDRVGWYVENSGNQLHAVGEKEANAFGLYDVHGNVWEWCMDGYGPYDVEPRAGDGLRHQPEGDRIRVGRGGCWFYVAVLARAAFRYAYGPGDRDFDFGFRVARVIT